VTTTASDPLPVATAASRSTNQGPRAPRDEAGEPRSKPWSATEAVLPGAGRSSSSSSTTAFVRSPVTAAVLVVARSPGIVEPLRAACAAVGLGVWVADDATNAATLARAPIDDGQDVAGVIVDVGAVDDLADALCEELRLIRGYRDAPILFIGAAVGPLSSTNEALAVGGDAFFALPVDAVRVLAKLLSYTDRAVSPGDVPASLVLADDGPVWRPAVYASGATPDELLAALEEIVPVRDERDERDERTGATAATAAPSGEDDDRRSHKADGNEDGEATSGGHDGAEHASRGGGADESADGGEDDNDEGEPVAGALAAGEAAAWLWRVHRRRTTGLLEFLDEHHTKWTCTFVRGALCDVRSTGPSEGVGEILVRLGLTTQARWSALRGQHDLPSAAAPLTALLVQRGALLPSEELPARRAVLAEQLAAVVSVQAGAWQLKKKDEDGETTPTEPDEQTLPVVDHDDFAAFLAEAVRRRLDDVCGNAVLGSAESVLAPRKKGRAVPAHFLPEEARTLAAMNGRRSLAELERLVGVGPSVIRRAALLGLVFGAVRMVSRAPTKNDDDARNARTKARELEAERVLDRLLRARQGDLFFLLSLSLEASAHDVACAARSLRGRFDPTRAVERGVGELRAALREINAAIDEAEAILLDDELRTAHRRRLLERSHGRTNNEK
jgi:hypothetical protein